jgi:rare lipoprotein A
MRARVLAVALVATGALALAGCGGKPVRPVLQPVASRTPPPVSRDAAPRPVVADPCAPTRIHRDEDYTPGGLYAPGVSDGGPIGAIDVSAIPEPVPRREPRARQGNRSPYTVLGKNYRVMDSSAGYRERGIASWYGTKFNGRATSSGELYDICKFSAAHKTLPLPSYVRVTNLANGRSVVVRVNDRGPFHAGRVMDLSYAAAVRLGVDRTGTASVELVALDGDGDEAPAPPRSGGIQARSPPPLPPSLPAVGEAGSIVQVGSFGEQGNAHRLAERLRDAGFDGVGIDAIERDGRPMWRVRLGPVAARSLAAIIERLHGMGLPNARALSR